jgi:hypothetical protein
MKLKDVPDHIRRAAITGVLTPKMQADVKYYARREEARHKLRLIGIKETDLELIKNDLSEMERWYQFYSRYGHFPEE